MADPAHRTVREAVGFFHSAGALERGIEMMESHGFHRSRMSVLARESLEGHMRDHADDMHELADNPDAHREAVISNTDYRQGRVLGTGLASAVTSVGAAGITLMTGGAALAAFAAAAAAGLGTSAATTMLGRKAEQGENTLLKEQMEKGGALLWVQTMTPEEETRAQQIMREHGASDVHVHTIAAD